MKKARLAREGKTTSAICPRWGMGFDDRFSSLSGDFPSSSGVKIAWKRELPRWQLGRLRITFLIQTSSTSFFYHLVLCTFTSISPVHKFLSPPSSLQRSCAIKQDFPGCDFVAPPASYKYNEFGDGNGSEVPVEHQSEWGTT
jgi:hypothetical protein